MYQMMRQGSPDEGEIGTDMAMPRINPAEFDWDRLKSFMKENGWEMSSIVIVHRGSKIIAELGTDLLCSPEAMELALRQLTILSEEFMKAPKRQIN